MRAFSVLIAALLLTSSPAYCEDETDLGGNILESKNVILLVSCLGIHDPDFAFDLTYLNKLKGQLAKEFPNRPIRVITPGVSENLAEEIHENLHDGEVVSHLVINGHGNSRDGHYATILLLVGQREYRNYMPVNSPKLVPPNSNKSDTYCSPAEVLEGRYSKDAKIYFNNCYLLKGDEKNAIAKAYALAELFAFRNGEFYANKIAGRIPLWSTYLAIPFWRFQGAENRQYSTAIQFVTALGAAIAVAAGVDVAQEKFSSSTIQYTKLRKLRPLFVFTGSLTASTAVMYITIANILSNQGYYVKMKNSEMKELKPMLGRWYFNRYFSKNKEPGIADDPSDETSANQGDPHVDVMSEFGPPSY